MKKPRSPERGCWYSWASFPPASLRTKRAGCRPEASRKSREGRKGGRSWETGLLAWSAR